MTSTPRCSAEPEGSPYVLVGLMCCGVCSGSMEVVSWKSGARRAFAYRGYKARRQGMSVCTNKMPVRMTDADDAVLSAVEKTLLNPVMVERALALAEAELIAAGAARRRAPLVVELAALDADVKQLTTAISAAATSIRCSPTSASPRRAAANSATRSRPPPGARRRCGPREAAELRRGLPEPAPGARAADAADPAATRGGEAHLHAEAEWRLRVRREGNCSTATRWGDVNWRPQRVPAPVRVAAERRRLRRFVGGVARAGEPRE